MDSKHKSPFKVVMRKKYQTTAVHAYLKDHSHEDDWGVFDYYHKHYDKWYPVVSIIKLIQVHYPFISS